MAVDKKEGIARDFEELYAAALARPGVEEVMAVFGDSESALALMEFYLSIEQPRPASSVSSSTS
jgi:hypothetical protein